MQHGVIETRIPERQCEAVALHRGELDFRRPLQGARKHGAGEIQPDVAVAARKKRQIEAAAHAVEEHPAAAGCR
ncbi:hypothetical protein D3C83_03210 [compost metagenome]